MPRRRACYRREADDSSKPAGEHSSLFRQFNVELLAAKASLRGVKRGISQLDATGFCEHGCPDSGYLLSQP